MCVLEYECVSLIFPLHLLLSFFLSSPSPPPPSPSLRLESSDCTISKYINDQTERTFRKPFALQTCEEIQRGDRSEKEKKSFIVPPLMSVEQLLRAAKRKLNAENLELVVLAPKVGRRGKGIERRKEREREKRRKLATENERDFKITFSLSLSFSLSLFIRLTRRTSPNPSPYPPTLLFPLTPQPLSSPLLLPLPPPLDQGRFC